MTNREFYKEQILDVVCTGHSFCVDKTGNMIHDCNELDCYNCLFNHHNCNAAIEEWCNAEYIEPCLFEEGELVEVSDDNIVWYLEFFSHIDTGNVISKYVTYTHKDNSINWVNWRYCQKYGTLGGLIKGEEYDT